jgi:hypothetical protein
MACGTADAAKPVIPPGLSVTYLAIHVYSGGMASPPMLFGEVVDPASPDPVSATLVVKWRDFGGTVQGYQSLAYRLDEAGRTLRIAWGAIAPSPAGITMPSVPDDSDPCDGSSLTCRNHERPGS